MNPLPLLPFQRRFLRAALAPGIDTACLSGPRALGKSWIAGHILARALTPDDPLFRAGTESVLCAASIEQARIVFRFARAALAPVGGYRFLDSATRAGITHLASNTRLRVIGSNGRTAMGLVNCPLAVCDEPGAWEVKGGELLHDAVQTAQGKPGSPLRAIYIGTLAPALDGWWRQMAEAGSNGSTHVTLLQGRRGRWRDLREIRRVNPLTAIDSRFLRKLVEERDAARRDTRLKARFLSYRLNLPTADESTVLLTVEDWARVMARPVPEPDGRPIIGLDLGQNRAWSAAVALFPNGRCEALAVAPGIPDLGDQEKRDIVPAGTYRRLHELGVLHIVEGLRVPPVRAVVNLILERWGRPRVMVSDFFRLADLQDNCRGVRIETRRTRWSEASFDIRSLRKAALDGPLAAARPDAALIEASLAFAMVKNDEGNERLVKRGANNTARDDVAMALTLAAGAQARRPARSGGVFLGAVQG